MMYCEKCGQEIEERLICPKCGCYSGYVEPAKSVKTKNAVKDTWALNCRIMYIISAVLLAAAAVIGIVKLSKIPSSAWHSSKPKFWINMMMPSLFPVIIIVAAIVMLIFMILNEGKKSSGSGSKIMVYIMSAVTAVNAVYNISNAKELIKYFSISKGLQMSLNIDNIIYLIIQFVLIASLCLLVFVKNKKLSKCLIIYPIFGILNSIFSIISINDIVNNNFNNSIILRSFHSSGAVISGALFAAVSCLLLIISILTNNKLLNVAAIIVIAVSSIFMAFNLGESFYILYLNYAAKNVSVLFGIILCLEMDRRYKIEKNNAQN